MNMKKQLLFVTLAASMLAGCSNDENSPVVASASNELGVSVNVVSSVSTRALRDGISFVDNDAIGVFVTGTGYTSKVAPYSLLTSVWTSPTLAADKIYLTNEIAMVYAFYPSSATTNPTTLAGDGTDLIDATLAADETSFDGTGQTDYMYGTAAATSGTGTTLDPYLYAAWPQASNAAADVVTPAAYDNKVDLYMHHALAKLSFVVNKAESYGGTGLVTSIKVNSGTSTTAPLSGTFTMKISDGSLTTTASTVGAISFTDATGVNANAYNATPSTVVTAYGLALPAEVADLTLTVTVDGKEMTAALPALPDAATAWAAGNNYTYTLLINGTELEVTTVSIVDWNSVDVNSSTPVDFN